MTLFDFIIRGIKHGFRTISRKTFLNPVCDCDRQSANDNIFNLLSAGKPCMISRFGTTELNCINNYLCIISKRNFLRKCIDFIVDNTNTPWWYRDHYHFMNIYSGIFPECDDTAVRFSQRYLEDIPEIDLLGCFQYKEKFMPLRDNVIKVQLETLYPFFVEKPWTRFLKNKKVLVIHPFEQSIRQQYEKREFLFNNPDILPTFELKLLKAIQSIAGNKTQFNSWFDALKYMEDEIDKIDFDICLLGCGAYGLPLAAHIKRMGKQAVHLGGGLQLLFGIKGKRWTEQYSDVQHYRPGIDINTNYRPLFNKHWIYPLDMDIPQNSKSVENACYWK